MNVEIHIPAVRVEEIESATTSRVTVETRDETTVVKRIDVTENPNFDYYLQPKGDLVYDHLGHKGTFTFGETEFQQTSDEIEIEFNCHPSELREAAQKRAAEDWCHEVQTLASWLSLADDRYEDLAGCLEEALDDASEESPEAQYRVKYGGGANPTVDTTDGSLGNKPDFEAQA